jgi:nucleoside-diphosphate-sugar epimerase
MNILVTGGGGFLGSAVCRQLAERGHDVRALQRRPATHLESIGVRSIEADIDDADAVARAAEACGAIVHTAGKAGIWGDPADFRRVNVDGTANVLRACEAHGIPFLVHTSSPSVVHAGGDIEGGDESLPLATRFSAPYPETKAEAERLVTRANSATLRTVSLRPHLIWGPGDPHILPRLVAKARGGRLALPAPHKVIDTIFVENAALAHVLALEELLGEGRCAGKAYFVTNHEPLPQGEIIRKLLAAVGVEVKIRAVPAGVAMAAGAIAESTWRLLRLGSEPPVTRFSVEQLATAHWFDPSAAQRDFGYKPKYSIDEALGILAREGL